VECDIESCLVLFDVEADGMGWNIVCKLLLNCVVWAGRDLDVAVLNSGVARVWAVLESGTPEAHKNMYCTVTRS